MKKKTNKENIWIKSIAVGFVSFVILFLSLNMYQQLINFTYVNIKESFILLILVIIPFFFVRRITLSSHPKKVFLLLFLVGVPLLFSFVMYITPTGDVLDIYFFSEIMFKFYLYVFSFFFFLTIYFYYKDTKVGTNIPKNKFFNIFLLLIFIPGVFAVSDLNTTNNVLNRTINVTDTRDLNLAYIDISSGASSFELSYLTTLSNAFLLNTYPLKDYGLNSWLNEEKFPTELIPAGSDNDKRDLADFLNKVYKMGVTNNPDRVVGILPAGFLHQHFLFLDSNTHGVTFMGAPTVFVENIDIHYLVAHELGHTYFLCDEYGDWTWFIQNINNKLKWGFECPNGDKDDDGLLDPECEPNACPTSTLSVVNNPYDNLLNLMGSISDNNLAWVSKDTYIHLLNSFDKTKPNYLPKVETEGALIGKAIIITGIIGENGSASLETAYVVENVTFFNYSGNNNASFDIMLLNNSEGAIFNQSFGSSFQIVTSNGSTINTTEAPFQYLLPWNETIQYIRIYFNGSISAEIDVSPNTPQISLGTIDNSSLITEPFTLIWNASDADSDPLYYAILASLDGGDNYTTLEVDYNQTSYEIDPNDFTYSEQYLFKVLVTDGINTNHDITNTFSMGVHPADLFINVKTVNDTYNDVNGTDTVTLDYITASPQYSSITTFSNNLSAENMTFAAGQSITRYLRLPKYINVTSASLNITGRGAQE